MNRAPLYSDQLLELMSERAIENPHEIYARLRSERPLSRVAESGVHIVATWALIDEVLGREEDFSANLTGVLFRGEGDEPSAFELPSTGATDVIATADEPRHAIHRFASQPTLDARRIATLEADLRVWTRDSLAQWIEAGGAEIAPLTERIPALAVARILGLPEEDVRRFRVGP